MMCVLMMQERWNWPQTYEKFSDLFDLCTFCCVCWWCVCWGGGFTAVDSRRKWCLSDMKTGEDNDLRGFVQGLFDPQQQVKGAARNPLSGSTDSRADLGKSIRSGKAAKSFSGKFWRNCDSAENRAWKKNSCSYSCCFSLNWLESLWRLKHGSDLVSMFYSPFMWDNVLNIELCISNWMCCNHDCVLGTI